MIKKPKFRQKNRLKLHEDTVIALHSPGGPSGANLYSCSKDGLVRVLDFNEKKIASTVTMLKTGPQIEEKQVDIMTDQGDLKKISFDNLEKKPLLVSLNSALFTENSLYGGYQDGDVFCWNIKTGEVIYEMKGHTKAVRKLLMLNPRVLASASADGFIYMWDTTTGLVEAKMKFEGSIADMLINNKILYILFGNNQIGLFNTADDYNHLKTFYFENKVITTFLVKDDLLFIANSNNDIEILEIQGDRCEPKHTLKGHSDWVMAMKIHDGHLFSGSDDKSVKVWNLETHKLVDEFTDHEDGVTCIEFCDGNIYSGSYDHLIRHWSIEEMHRRILDRKLMAKEDLLSRKYEAYGKIMFKKKGKGKKGGKKK